MKQRVRNWGLVCMAAASMVFAAKLGLADPAVPHPLYVTVQSGSGDSPATGDLTFQAWLTKDTESILTETSFDCNYGSTIPGYASINCGNFATAWTADDVVHIEVEQTSTGDVGTREFTLSNDNFQIFSAGDGIIIASAVSPSQVWVDGDYTAGSCGGHTWANDAFTNIQAAVDAVAPSGTVNVAAGTYAEHITVDRTVDILGADRTTTVIDGGGSGLVVDITASGVTFAGFTVRKSGATPSDVGVLLDSVSGVTVSDNVIEQNSSGIVLLRASNNFTTGNTVTGNTYYGIALIAASDNTLNLNTINGNGLDALALDNAASFGGTVLEASTGNHIEGNIISSARDGIFVGEHCDNNQIIGTNSISNAASIGINLWRSGGQTIANNTICSSLTGIRLLGSSGNTIIDNAVMANDCGVKVDASWQLGIWHPSSNNTISANRISGNTTQGMLADAVHGTVVIAEGNWWGASTGPTNATANPLGRGDGVSDYVDFAPWWGDPQGNTSYTTNIAGGANLQDEIDAACDGDCVIVVDGACASDLCIMHDIGLAGAPLNLCGNILIGSGHTVTLSSGVTAATLTIGAGASLKIVNATLTANGLTMTGTFTLDDTWGTATTLDLPFVDNFELYADGTELKDLGFSGWYASDTNVVIQSTNTYNSSDRAVQVTPNAQLSNSVDTTALALTNVWTDFRTVLGLFSDTNHPAVPDDAIVLFHANSNGHLVIYDKDALAWVTCTNSVFPGQSPSPIADTWVRITLNQNYQTKKVALFLDGLLLRQNLPFIHNATDYHSLSVSNTGNNAFLDDVYIGVDIPGMSENPDLNWVADMTNDYDGDGMADASEIEQVGNADEVRITATAGDHGAITPSGSVWVTAGGSTNFTYQAQAHWFVSEVRTNGVLVDGFQLDGQKSTNGSYTWDNIQSVGTIDVSFSPLPGPVFGFR